MVVIAFLFQNSDLFVDTLNVGDSQLGELGEELAFNLLLVGESFLVEFVDRFWSFLICSLREATNESKFLKCLLTSHFGRFTGVPVEFTGDAFYISLESIYICEESFVVVGNYVFAFVLHVSSGFQQPCVDIEVRRHWFDRWGGFRDDRWSIDDFGFLLRLWLRRGDDRMFRLFGSVIAHISIAILAVIGFVWLRFPWAIRLFRFGRGFLRSWSLHLGWF